MQDLDLYVSDWRSPIGAIYYNSRLGETQFKTPAGFISCNLEQRRQIKIKDGKVKRVILSDVHISDDELQEVLSQSSSNKMHNIVTTIQEEQNDIIWNVKDKHMIVQGCAGSGKTSVGLHRLAFLLFNSHPAKVIMGDTGSLALGGALAAVAIITRHEITLIVVAGVFVIETLSAIIQRFAGRYWGKRVFLMAPLHHHFEKLGWNEQDIVKLFWAVGLMLAMAAIIYGVWI